MASERRNYTVLVGVIAVFLLVTVTGAYIGALEWDEGSFLLNAEYFAGTDTNFEESRPHALSFLISLVWQVTGESTVTARLLVVLFGVGTILLFHRITREDDTISHPLLLTVAYAFTPLLLYWSFHAYTDVPAFLFVLGALYAYKTDRHIAAGVLLAVAGTIRYVFLIFAAGMAIGYLFEHRNVFHRYAVGGVLGAIPFFTYSTVGYRSPLSRIVLYTSNVAAWSGSGLFAATADNATNAVYMLSTLLPAAALGWRETPTVEKTVVLTYAAFFLFFSGMSFTRYWLPMVPFLLLMTDRGVSRYIERVQQYVPEISTRTVVAVVAGAMLLISGYWVGVEYTQLQTCAAPFNDAIDDVQTRDGVVVSDRWSLAGYLLDRKVYSTWTDYDTLRDNYSVSYAIVRDDLPYKSVYTAENICKTYHVYDLRVPQ